MTCLRVHKSCAHFPQQWAWVRSLIILCLTLSLTALSGCGSEEKARALPTLPTDAVVLAFGDSLTYGTGAARDESYPAVLETLIDRKVVNAGVPGETTEGGLKRLPGVLARGDFDLAILCLGGNDFLRRKPLQQTRDNLLAIIQQLRAADIPILFLAVPEPKLGVRPSPLYAELADEMDLSFMQDTVSDILSDRGLKSDPIHPNDRGYARMAEEIRSHLQRAGAIR